MSIVVIGCVFVDIKGYPSRTYIPGGRNAGKVRYVHGGVSRNIAEDLGNLGLDPVLLSLVDPNGAGEDVLTRLAEHGVDTRLIRKVPDGMGTWLAVFDNNNDVCASISHRPDLSPLLPVLQAEGNPLFASADSILLELDLDEALMEEIYRLKHKYGKNHNRNFWLRRARLSGPQAFRKGDRRGNSRHGRYARRRRCHLGGPVRTVRRLRRAAGTGSGYHRSRGRLLCRRCRRSDLWQNAGRSLLYRRPACFLRHLFPGKHLSAFPAIRVRAETLMENT